METVAGILLVFSIMICIYALMTIRRYKKSFQTELTVFETKMQQLETMLNNSDEMVNELNNLSDYVVVRVEEANTQLVNTLSTLDEKVKSGSELIEDLEVQLELHNDLLVQSAEICEQLPDGVGTEAKKGFESIGVRRSSNGRISINPKHAEALKLSEEGMGIREIARKLDIGQGEVQLLLGLKK